MSLRWIQTAIYLVAILLFLGANGSGQNRLLTPKVIVKRMATQYAFLNAYQDNGSVDIVDEARASRRTDVLFRTYFARPSGFRFEWTNIYPMNLPSLESMIWCDRRNCHTASRGTGQQAELEDEEDLDSAVERALGTSRQSVHTIPILLMPTVISGFAVTELSNLALVREEQFEGDDCYLVRGRGPEEQFWDIWIGKRDFLLRKVRTKHIDGVFFEEIHRQIKRNNPLSPDIFRLKPGPDVMAAVVIKSKEHLIRRLLELIIPVETLNQAVNDALDKMKELLPQVPEGVWIEVTKDVKFNSEIIAQMYISQLEKHYDEAEIAGLIRFYQTPLGKKAARVTPLIETEGTKISSQKVRELLLRVYERLREKGYKPVATTTNHNHCVPTASDVFILCSPHHIS